MKKRVTVLGKSMAYVERGEGDPIVFLHGNPTSSYLWRDVMPRLEGKGRLIAPDLIGMGDSDKLESSGPGTYTFLRHRDFLFSLLETLGVRERVTRDLSAEEIAEYRRPFAEPGESRRPTLTWPRQLPIEGEHAEVVEIIEAYARWLDTCEIPKLFINADPGAILRGPNRERVRGWPNLTEVTVKGIHFIQEDSPVEIGDAIADWLEST
ncbi:MAG: alpha/beta fold hydrolase [Myxococcota bacterium]